MTEAEPPMRRLAGFIGHLPEEQALRTVATMASAMQRGPRRFTSRCAVPELGIYLGWVASQIEATADATAPMLLVAGDGVPTEPLSSAYGRGVRADMIQQLRNDEATTLSSLNGFFAGVFIDPAPGRTLLFTDRHGIERLYACETADGLYFASEAKALLRVLPRTRAFDDEGLAQYLTFGCTVPPRTLFRGISVLPKAAQWGRSRGAWNRRRYFDRAEWEAQDALPLPEFERAYADTFAEVLPRYFSSASRVGLALTGGLDTRMILAARPKVWEAPISYTYSGPRDTRDVTLARALAGTCAVPHEVIRLDAGFLRDFPDHADRTVVDTDGAHGVTGSHEPFLSARARLLAPVRLTGVFGGEVLRGLSPWRRLGIARDLLDHELQASVTSLRAAAPREHPVTAAAFGTTPDAMHGILSSCRAWLDFRTPFLDTRLVRLAYRAPRGAATEHSAVRMLLRHMPPLSPLPTDRGRQVGRARVAERVTRAFEQLSFKLDYVANESLVWPFTKLDPLIDRCHRPGGPLGRHKFLSYRRWFRRELADYVQDRVAAARRMSIWRADILRRLAVDHVYGAANLAEELNVVLTLEAVDRLLLRGGTTLDTPSSGPSMEVAGGPR